MRVVCERPALLLVQEVNFGSCHFAAWNVVIDFVFGLIKGR